MISPTQTRTLRPRATLAGGRMIKWKGRVASLSPAMVDLRGSVSAVALAGALAVAGGMVLAPGLAVAGTCTGGGGTYTCSGAAGADTTQTLTSSPLTVSTVSGFGITTASGDAITLSSTTGGIIFTDANSSAITGSSVGLRATNSSGALSITTTGLVTGGGDHGIFATNNSGATDLTISAANVSGGRGISAYNRGTGATSVTITGTATGSATGPIYGQSIFVYGKGTSVTLTAANATSGIQSGSAITVDSRVSGATTITTTGAVTAGFSDTNALNHGIYVFHRVGTDLTINAADVTAGGGGIIAKNYGTGSTSVTVSGAIRSTATSLRAGITTRGVAGQTVAINLLSTASVSAPYIITDYNSNATVTVSGATLTGNIRLGNGADTLTITSGTNLSGVATMSGGSDASIDTLNLNAAFSNSALSDWEVINLDATGAAFTVGSAITGTGTVNVLGSGIVTLSGTNTLTGATTVSGGTLNLTGSLASSAVTVASGATLSGTGSVSSLAAQSGSIIFAGAASPSFGALTVSGNASLASGSTLTIGVFGTGSTEHAQLIVGGAATLAGALYVDVTAGNTGATALASGSTVSNVLVTSSGITGAFASVTDNSALFDFAAVTNGNAVDLLISSAGTGTGGGTTVTALGAVNTAGLVEAVGAAAVFDRLITNGTSGDMQTVVTALGSLTTQAAVAQAVYKTVPPSRGVVARVVKAAASAVSNAFKSVFGRKKSRAGLGLTNGEAWLSPLGGWGEQSERNGAAGYDAKLYGMVAGADAEVAPDLRLGLAFAYTQSRIKSASDSTDNSLTVDGYEASIYGAWDVAEDISLLGGLSFGRNEFDGSRHMSFATLNRTARASYGGYAFSAETSVEKRFLVADALTFTPSVGLRYRASWDEGYAETGANALNLQVDGQQSRSLLSGVDGQLDYMLANGVELSANAGVAYDLINDRSHLTLAYQGASANPFQVDGAQGDPWTGHAGVGLKINLDSGVDINAAYQFGTGDGLSSHTTGLSAKFAF